jgi:vanillate O-demethylase ferredoxin subunit
MSPAIRKWLVAGHKWTGLTLGLIFVVMAATGATLVFRSQLEPVVSADLYTATTCETKLPLDSLRAQAASAYPTAEIDYVRILGEKGRPILFRFDDSMTLYLDPCTGQVLGQQFRFSGVFGRLEQIHRFRFMPNYDLVTGTVALGFLFPMAGLGVYLWLPRRKGMVGQALRYQPTLRGWPWLMNVHKLTGIYFGAIIALSALTGLPQAFPWAKAAIYSLSGSPLPMKAPTVEPRPEQAISYESLWLTALKLVPAPQEALMHFPTKQGQAVEIFLIDQHALHRNARTYLYLDPGSGEVIRFTPYSDSSLGHKLYFWTLSWHTAAIGGIAGLIGQLLLLAGALSGLILAFTGILTYVRRRKV